MSRNIIFTNFIMGEIIVFCGRECPDCIAMQPVIDQLISDGVEMEQLEVWHDEKNMEEMEKYEEIIKKASGGNMPTPTFLDKTENRAICGQMSYEELKKWINN